jgi:hypothetical protein
MYRISHKEAWLANYFILNQDIVENLDSGCHGGTTLRGKHIITVNNCNFGLKYIVSIRCFSDSMSVKFCEKCKSGHGCCGRSEPKVQQLYTRTEYWEKDPQYWQGSHRQVITYFCWLKKDEDPTMNLNFDINYQSFDRNPPSRAIETQNANFNVSFT